jgi:AbrB family looped-hinge helix DNA binding protein
MHAVLTEDGQLAIPKELQEQLGLKPGSVLELQNQAGTLVVWKKVEPDVFEKWRGRGKLPSGLNADEYLRLIRDGDSR